MFRLCCNTEGLTKTLRDQSLSISLPPELKMIDVTMGNVCSSRGYAERVQAKGTSLCDSSSFWVQILMCYALLHTLVSGNTEQIEMETLMFARYHHGFRT